MKISLFNNLRVRFLFILLFSVLVSTSIVSVFLYQHFHHFLNDRFDTDLQKYIILTEQALNTQRFEAQDTLYLKQFVDERADIFKCRITFMNNMGEVIVDSDIPTQQLSSVENHLNRPEILQANKEIFGSDIRHSATIGQDLLYKAMRLKNGAKQVGYIRFAIKMSHVNRLLEVTRNYFILGSIGILLLSSILVLLFSKKINNQLYKILTGARKIARGDLQTRIRIDSQNELSLLSDQMNEMARKLSGYVTHVQKEKQNLDTVLESIHEGLLAIDHNQKIIFHNKHVLSLLNLAELKNVHTYFYHAIRNKHLTSLISSYFTTPVYIKDRLKAGKNVMDVVITPLEFEGSPSPGAVVVLRDITHTNKLEKIRTEFVANVSHEFKTPLAAIRGYSETLLDWGLTDSALREKYVKKIVHQSIQLENLVTDLLALARIEKLQNIELVPFNLVPIINDVVAEVQEEVLHKEQNLELLLKSDVMEIVGEAKMFRSIMVNLINNAIKYTPAKGNITIECKPVFSQMHISVIDDGLGIPLKDQSRVFERFYRVDKGRNRAIPGTGLGLSIVKHMADLQNAEIKLFSEEGKGSTFSLWYPIGDTIEPL